MPIAQCCQLLAHLKQIEWLWFFCTHLGNSDQKQRRRTEHIGANGIARVDPDSGNVRRAHPNAQPVPRNRSRRLSLMPALQVKSGTKSWWLWHVSRHGSPRMAKSACSRTVCRPCFWGYGLEVFQGTPGPFLSSVLARDQPGQPSDRPIEAA